MLTVKSLVPLACAFVGTVAFVAPTCLSATPHVGLPQTVDPRDNPIAGVQSETNAVYQLADDAGLLNSAAGRLLLKYTVECALPGDESIMLSPDDEAIELHGSIGLAPGWKNEQLSPTSQRWLTACILSRINAFGVTVHIDLRGDHPGLQTLTDEELGDYTYQEGAFYGNFFADPPVIYTCRGSGGATEAPTKQLRVCTEPSGDGATSRCGMVYAGECADVCEGEDPLDHSMRNCIGGSTHYPEVVTVFLKSH